MTLGYPPRLVRAAPDFASLRSDGRFREREYQVKIEVDNGVIVCNVKDGKVKGGNVVVSSTDTNTIHFIGNGVKFGLSFASLPTGTYYKHGVSVVGVPALDPVIIVDK